MRKKWTKEEEELLEELWGTKSLKAIAARLDRSEDSIINKKQHMKLGSFLESSEYVSFNQLLSALGYGSGYTYKLKSWIQDRGFPIQHKKVNRCSFRVVNLDNFWKWAANNKDLLDFSNFCENALGKEPDWVKLKRRHDKDIKKKYKMTPWTRTEDEQLKYLLRQQKYSYDELSNRIGRTCGAIQRRCCDLNIMDRPIKADNHIKYTSEEETMLLDLIREGHSYESIAIRMNRSSKALRGKIGRMYGSENLDKVRLIMNSEIIKK